MPSRDLILLTVAFGIFTVMLIWVLQIFRERREFMVARIINGPNATGAFLATDETAISKLTNPDAYPANIVNLQMPVPISKADQSGLVFLPNGTRARVMTYKVFRGGRFVASFPANAREMMEAEAVDMVRVRVIEGLHTKAVPPSFRSQPSSRLVRMSTSLGIECG